MEDRYNVECLSLIHISREPWHLRSPHSPAGRKYPEKAAPPDRWLPWNTSKMCIRDRYMIMASRMVSVRSSMATMAEMMPVQPRPCLLYTARCV